MPSASIASVSSHHRMSTWRDSKCSRIASVQEKRLPRGRVGLLRCDAIEDGCGDGRCLVLHFSGALRLPLNELSGRRCSALHLVDGSREQVTLADSIMQTQELGSICRADDS